MRQHTSRLYARPQRTWLASLSLLGLAACASGPDFKPPAALVAPATTGYTASALAPQSASAPGVAGAAQTLRPGSPVSAQWWSVFKSTELDALVQRALARSPTVASAQAALKQAQEIYLAQSGALEYPNVSAQLAAEREHASAVSTGVRNGTVLNLFNASVNVSYTVDLNGSSRRLLEGQQAAADYQKYQLEAAYLSLTANVVTAAVREASLRGQIKLTQDLLHTLDQQLKLLEQQQALGSVGQVPVLQQRSLIAQTKASLPPLEKALEQTRHLLAVLVGELPSQAQLPSFSLEQLQLPVDVPVSLPSELARQRPDVRAAEEQLHQASAALGVASANLYPQLVLSSSWGSSALKPEKLFSPGWGFWTLAGGLVEPLFDGGALQAKERAAQAGLELAAQQYRQTVLLAFQNVADSLRALDSDASALRELAASEDALGQAHRVIRQQYDLGAISYLNVLDSQRAYQQAQVAVIAARAARLADTAALYQALGGGWWNRAPAQLAQNPAVAAH